MEKKRYHRCSYCDKKAVWEYMPLTEGRRYYCDDHVPRGCLCNVFNINEFTMPENGNTNVLYWNDKDISKYCDDFLNESQFTALGSPIKKLDSTYYEELDELGRRNPCCEFDYSEEGFEIESPKIMIKKYDLLNCIAKVRFSYFLYMRNINWVSLIRFLRDNYDKEVDYNAIFRDMEKNMNDNFIIKSDLLLSTVFIRKRNNIVRHFINEIRKWAREYRYKKYSDEDIEI